MIFAAAEHVLNCSSEVDKIQTESLTLVIERRTRLLDVSQSVRVFNGVCENSMYAMSLGCQIEGMAVSMHCSQSFKVVDIINGGTFITLKG